MNRRVAILLGSVLAAVAVAEIVILSGLLAAERRGDRDRYEDAISRQRRAAGRLTHSSPIPTKRTGPRTFCVGGVDTFATTARKTLQKDLLDGDKRLDIDEFHALSDLAIQAERYVEASNAGPALPQRLGRTRVEPSDEASSSTEAKKWQPLAPPQIECEDREAYAAFRLDVETPPAVPAAPQKAPSKPKKRPKKQKRR